MMMSRSKVKHKHEHKVLLDFFFSKYAMLCHASQHAWGGMADSIGGLNCQYEVPNGRDIQIT